MPNLPPASISDVAAALVSRGLVSRRELDQASTQRDRDGGSLALKLVLLGAIDDAALADFYADYFGVARADGAWLSAPDRDAFDAVPFDVAYEAGLAPMGYASDGRLVVGVVDPCEQSGIEEAEFFAGREFDVRVCSVSEFARLFERVAERPWKVPSEELRGLRQSVGPSRSRLDADLEELFRGGSASGEQSALRTGGAGHDSKSVLVVDLVHAEDEPVLVLEPKRTLVRVEVVAETDGPVVDLAPKLRSSPSLEILGDEQTVELPQEDVVDDLIVEEILMYRAPGGSAGSGAFELELLDDSFDGDEEVIELRSRPSATLTVDVPANRSADADDIDDDAPTGELRRSADPVGEPAPNQTIGRYTGPATVVQAGPEARGDTVTPAMSLEAVFDDGWDDVLPAHLSRAPNETPAATVSAVLATDGPSPAPPNPVLTEAFRASGAHSVTGDVSRAPAPRPVPTVGEYLGAEHDGAFVATADVIERLGPASDATRATFHLLESALSGVADRDGVARQLVETLGLAFPTVLLLSLRSPRVVVWDGVLATGAECPLGLDFALAEGSVWHRVASEGVTFVGAIPVSDPLRRRLPRAFGASALTVPLTLRGRVVALLVLDSGSASEVAAPGESLAGLVDWVEAALKRVIVQRKHGNRVV